MATLPPVGIEKSEARHVARTGFPGSAPILVICRIYSVVIYSTTGCNSVMTLRQRLAHNLRNLRTERGYSQEELAYRAGVDRTYISLLERSLSSASLDVIEQLAQALKVDALVLIAPVATASP